MLNLSFFKDYLQLHSDLIVSGIIQLIKNCPIELASIRRELLAISRHLFVSDLKTSKWEI